LAKIDYLNHTFGKNRPFLIIFAEVSFQFNTPRGVGSCSSINLYILHIEPVSY
jgi:hypothetical protein